MGATSHEFDSPWKNVLERYFQPFLALCFPKVHAAINWSQPHEFLDFIDWVMKLPEGVEQTFRAELIAYEEAQQVKYVTSVERLAKKEGHKEGHIEGRKEGHKEGRKQGRREGAVRLLQRSIQLRFGVVPVELQEQLQGLSSQQLEDLMESVLTKSLEDVMAEVTAIAPPATER
jgi:flagellar biosynthesis/type III secretory pathway protein FliH